MVFETIAVELINRYLGTFVENLDTSQLKIGLWGGKKKCLWRLWTRLEGGCDFNVFVCEKVEI